MVRHHKGSRKGRTTKSQENVSILSYSAICIAASLLRATAKNCDAHNEN